MPVTVPHTELLDSGDQGFSNDNKGEASRYLLCDWANAQLLCQQLLGSTQTLGFALTQYVPPQPHPSRPYLYASKARIQGLGVPTVGFDGGVAYEKARVTVDYAPIDLPEPQRQENPTITYVTESRKFSAAMVTIPGRKFKYKAGPSSGKNIKGDITPAKRVPKLVWSLTIHRWNNPSLSNPDTPLNSKVGTINKSRFGLLWTFWPKETLLYMGMDLDREYTSDGASLWKATLNFEYNSNTWNKLLDADGKFYTVDPPIYETYNFDNML